MLPLLLLPLIRTDDRRTISNFAAVPLVLFFGPMMNRRIKMSCLQPILFMKTEKLIFIKNQQHLDRIPTSFLCHSTDSSKFFFFFLNKTWCRHARLAFLRKRYKAVYIERSFNLDWSPLLWNLFLMQLAQKFQVRNDNCIPRSGLTIPSKIINFCEYSLHRQIYFANRFRVGFPNRLLRLLTPCGASSYSSRSQNPTFTTESVRLTSFFIYSFIVLSSSSFNTSIFVMLFLFIFPSTMSIQQ